jgi:RNA polymerase sigma factor (sigma-70 family)
MTLALQGTPTIACSEHELVAAVRRGDDRAFEVLFSRYERRITAYVASMVGDHARAEDITQEVFISALRRMRATGREIAFKPWIYEIAKNACIDEFRRNRRTPEVSFDEDGAAANLTAPHVFVHAPAPHAAMESKQRLDDLCGAFGGLTESHHRVLVLRELEGLSYAEIGERLGMTRAMVESTLFRARRRLSEEYEDLSSGRRCARVQSLIDSGDRPLKTLGVRDRRQLTRHLGHCEPCRRRAQIMGLELDERTREPRRAVARIAALLPLPLTLLRWRRGPSSDEAAVQSGSHSIAVVQSLQNAAQLVDPSGPTMAFGRAAAAAVAIAVASAGGGLVASLGAGPAPKPRARVAASASRHPASSSAQLAAAAARRSGPADAGSQQVADGLEPAGSAGRLSGTSSGTADPRPGLGRSDGAGQAASGVATQTPSDSAGSSRAPSSTAAGEAVSVPGVAAQGTSSGAGTSTPTAPGSDSPQAPSTPRAPNLPSGAPNLSAPQPPSVSTGSVQNLQTPSTSPSQVQSTAGGGPSTVDQAAGGAQQQLPSTPSVAVPSAPPAG